MLYLIVYIMEKIMNNNYITVGALTRYIKYKIDNDVNLQNVYIKGEISNFKHLSRGHFYFTIKDEESRINAIMFASSTKNINFEPVDGMKVLVKGRISVFEQTGNYQIYVTDMIEDGVGNIYADESLWGAKVHPQRLTGSLTAQEIADLYRELREVMNLAIEKGGSSNHTYVNAQGTKGSYMDFARVFRREGLACPRCGATIEKSRVAGRGTHTCPVCQVL